jgi:hypothetical protein
MFLQISGQVELSPTLGVVITIGLAILSALTIWVATKFFQREVILTRWS